LPRLPILSALNRGSEREWHTYVERIYGAPVPEHALVDLNAFTFFYTHWDAHDAADTPPATLIEQSMCLAVCAAHLNTNTYIGTPWIGHSYPRTFVAANAFGAIGYFVRRPEPHPEEMERCSRLEVGHVLSTYKGGERGVSWFFHTVGSGVFLSCTDLRRRGRIKAYTTRRHFVELEHVNWDNDESFPWRFMEQHGLSALIFTAADFGKYGFSHPGQRSPRTEVIVRHKDPSVVEASGGNRGVCLDGGGMGIQTLAGWNGSHTCRCNPLVRDGISFLRCGGDRR